MRVLFIKYYLFPEQKKKFSIKKYEKKQQKKQDNAKPVLKQQKPDDKKPSILDEIKLIKEVLSTALNAASKYLHVKISKLHIKVATDDAANTAILYGAVSGAVAGIIELIDSYTNLKRLKKCAVIVEPDFLNDKTEVKLNISLSLSVFGALVILAKTLWRYNTLKYKKAN